jgi:hypothetical protein
MMIRWLLIPLAAFLASFLGASGLEMPLAFVPVMTTVVLVHVYRLASSVLVDVELRAGNREPARTTS